MRIKDHWLGWNYAAHLVLNGGSGMQYAHLNMAVATLQSMPFVRHVLRDKIRTWAITAVVKTTNHSTSTSLERALSYIQLTWAHIRAQAPRNQVERALNSAYNQLPTIVANTAESQMQLASVLAQIGDLCLEVGGIYAPLASDFYAQAIRVRVQ